MRFNNSNNNERRGTLAFTILFFLVLTVVVYVCNRPEEWNSGKPYAANQARQKGKKSSPKPYAQPERVVESFPFDPNTADSTQLLRLGLTPGQVRGIYKFRSMGYTYSTVEDFSYVPGLTQGQWNHLQPLIRISPEFQPVVPLPRKQRSHAGAAADANTQDVRAEYHRDTVQYPVKLHDGQVVELNAADTSLLKKIPGVGSYFARQIVAHRQRLGGFLAVEQVTEIPDFPETAMEFMEVKPVEVRKVQINKCSKRALVGHPYINADQARDIWEYRRNEGLIDSAGTLKTFPSFRLSDVERLVPYLDFSN